MQKFNAQNFLAFKKYYHINDTPSDTDIALLKKTYQYIKYIKRIPGIRFVGIGNSTAFYNSNKESDIDLFIITQTRRLWVVRIFTTLIFGILGVRKTQNKHAGRFCLSFFISEDALDFKDIALENDIYLYFWIIHLKPILDYNNTYDAFIKAQSWADLSPYKNIITQNKGYIHVRNSTSSSGIFFNWLDQKLKNIFLPRTLRHQEKLGYPYGVIVSNSILKFHNHDTRKQIKKDLGY